MRGDGMGFVSGVAWVVILFQETRELVQSLLQLFLKLARHSSSRPVGIDMRMPV